MERLHQIARAFAFIGYCTLSLCTTSAQNKCSLVVRVLSPNGQRIEVPVSVQEKNGNIEQKDQEGGDVRFCDLGILPVTVIVGKDGFCNQVTIHEVPLSWNETYLLRVTYDPEPCLRDTPPPPVPICRVLFRVAGPAGKWLSAVPIALLSPTQKMLTTDQYGRASFIMKVGDEIRGSITTSGFRPAEFTWTCSSSEVVHEQPVKLERP